MPICRECDEDFDEADFLVDGGEAIERIYRAVAMQEPSADILQMIYERFSGLCELAPPAHELRLAARLAAKEGV